MNKQNKPQDKNEAISECPYDGLQHIAAELSKTTSKEAEIVFSNSNITLFMKNE